MGKFSQTSLDRLGTCQANLERLFQVVVQDYDCAILCGHRNADEQHRAFLNGLSHADWPNSKHNTYPSLAVDVFPIPRRGWPIRSEDWNDLDRFRNFAHYVLGVARGLDIELRWGGDWDRDFDLHDNRFNDLVHFELVTR